MTEEQELVCAGCGKTFPRGDLVIVDDLPYHSEACWRESDAPRELLTLIVGLFLALVFVSILVVGFIVWADPYDW